MSTATTEVGGDFQKRFMTALGDMSYTSWVVLTKELGMTKEDILNEEQLIKVFTLWTEGERTPQALQTLLETSDRDLTNALGMDYDAIVAEALESAKSDPA